MTIRITIAGIMGRMGQLVSTALKNHPEVILQSGTVRSLEKYREKLDIPLLSDPFKAFIHTDVIIDFSTPSALEQNLAAALHYKKPILIGVTGLTPEQHETIREAAHTIPILLASNTSFGIAVMNQIAAVMTHLLGPEFDIEINEMHHRHKMDAPSGTAKNLLKTVAEARGCDPNEHVIYDRTTRKEPRFRHEIGLSVMRGGGVFGDHKIIFASNHEVLELHHRALSREVFAEGALKAALWLRSQKAGLYSMNDVFQVSACS